MADRLRAAITGAGSGAAHAAVLLPLAPDHPTCRGWL
jgi:hypothetical protein